MAGLLPTAEQQELREVVRSLVADRGKSRRDVIDSASGIDDTAWKMLVEQVGITGLIVPEVRGGAGFGWGELAVVLEEVGYGLISVPTLSGVMSTAALQQVPSTDAADELLRDIAAGQRRAATVFPLGLDATDVTATVTDGLLSLPQSNVVEAAGADDVLVVAREGDVLVLCHLDPLQAGVDVEAVDSVDLTRRVQTITAGAANVSILGPLDNESLAAIQTAARVALAAEQVGGARACLDMATAYARDRQQFDRAIGSFQSIKHQLADAFVNVEACVAALADALRALDSDPTRASAAVSVASSVAGDAFHDNAELNIHVHGGTGFTWEHDAHLYYRRALAANALWGHPRQLDLERGTSLVG